jgi:hypothetical protein
VRGSGGERAGQREGATKKRWLIDGMLGVRAGGRGKAERGEGGTEDIVHFSRLDRFVLKIKDYLSICLL